MTELTSQAILGDTIALVRRSGLRAVIALGALTIAGLASDMVEANGGQANLLASALGFAMQYWLTGELLEELELRGESGGRFWAVFGVCLLTNLGILLGFAMLIIPGIILLVRWSICVPCVLGDSEIGVADAIGQSWRETEGQFWPILLAYLVLYIPTLGASVAAAFASTLALGVVAGSLILNFCLNLGLIAGWHAAVAIYAARRPESQLAELFA